MGKPFRSWLMGILDDIIRFSLSLSSSHKYFYFATLHQLILFQVVCWFTDYYLYHKCIRHSWLYSISFSVVLISTSKESKVVSSNNSYRFILVLNNDLHLNFDIYLKVRFATNGTSQTYMRFIFSTKRELKLNWGICLEVIR